MRTRTIELIGAVASCLLLAGCASLGTPGPDGAPGADRDDGPAAPAATVDPVELVNLWRVLDAEDADAGDDPTWLRLDVGHYQLWRGCGFVEGAWEASAEALFIASAPFMSTEGCVAGAEWYSVPWLERVRTIERTVDGWTLVAADGRTLARLVVDGAPEPIDTAADFFAEPPEVTDGARSGLADPAPLPDGLVAPTVDELLGRWIPPGDRRTGSHVLLDEDLTWTGSDGCNGSGGAWTVGADGRLLATAGVSTMIGCAGSPVGSWLASAGRVGLDGQTLVLLDDDGAELGRLARA